MARAKRGFWRSKIFIIVSEGRRCTWMYQMRQTRVCPLTHPPTCLFTIRPHKQRSSNIFQEGTVEPWQCDMLVGRIKEMEFERGHFFFKEGLMATFLNSAIYFIRDGKIEVSNEKGQMVELKSGAFFGESTLKTFWKAMQESETGKVDNILALRTAQCLERCKLGVLSIAVIEDIIGIEHIHFKEFRNTKFEKMKDKLDWTITLDSLEKHYLLGKGVFGEVWLVSKRQDEAAKNAKERPIVYALKSQDKRYLLEHHDVNFVIREKNIMSSIDCPFIMKLVNTYQDERSIYMLMALGHGGELFNIICNQRISEGHTKFYAAGILVGLRYMHDRNILYRDIKAENILIDDKGYPVIIDMGFGELVLFCTKGGSWHNLYPPLTTPVCFKIVHP